MALRTGRRYKGERVVRRRNGGLARARLLRIRPLALDADDLKPLPLEERKRRLETLPRLESIAVDTAPFNPPPPPGALARRAHWVEPRLVAEVQFTEWTDDGKIRHPSLQGFRTDRRAAHVRREPEAESTN